jgi:tight adherence protein B
MDAILNNMGLLASLAAGLSIFLFVAVGSNLFLEAARKKEEQQREEGLSDLHSISAFVTPEQFFFLSVLSFLLLGGFFYLVSEHVVFGIVGAIMGLIIPRLILGHMQRKRLAQFELQLVDALTTMSNSLKAGYSLIQALELVAKEMSPPIAVEFAIATRENKLGTHLDKALSNMSRRVQSVNLELVITSIAIVRQGGGNLSEVFETIAETIRERTRLEGKLQAMTAQGKLQGVVLSILPVFLVIGVHFLQPTLLEKLYTDPIGWTILGIVLVLYATAGLLIRKVVNIEV